MLSQNHSSNQINFWLVDWKNRSLRTDEVIIDASEALISACVKTFAECYDANSYVTVCIDSVLYGTKPPACFIRLDVAHFVHALMQNKTFKQLHKKVQSLLLGVIGYVIHCERIEECEIILRHIFTLTKNEYVNDEVTSSKKFLTELVSTHEFTNVESPPSSLDCEEHIDIFHDDDEKKHKSTTGTYKDTSMYRWIMKIYESVDILNQSEGDSIDNIYCCAKAEKFVIKIFARLPMWSNIMCMKFNSKNFTATSSASESEFKNIKRLMGIKTNKPHVFVNLHLDQITGNSKLVSANQKSADAAATGVSASTRGKNTESRNKRSLSLSRVSFDSTKSTPNRSRSVNDFTDVIPKEFAENWKGRNRSPSMLKRSRASILNPHNIDYFCHDVPLLRNGYTSKSRKAGKKSIIVTNTCAMDSVFAIFCAAYLDNKVTKNDINCSTSANEFSFLIRNFFTSDEKPKFHYENRTKLLMKIFTKENYINQISDSKHSITVSCKSGIGGFFKKLVQTDNGKIASVEKTRQCLNCNYENVNYSSVVPLHVSINSDVNLFEIERYIVNEDTAFTCRECGNQSIVSQQFKNIIAFEVEPFVHKRMKKYTISQLKEKICVRGEIYNLFGLIENIPAIQHFVGHVKRNNGQWQSIDDLKTEIDTSRRITSISMYIFMLFYIQEAKD